MKTPRVSLVLLFLVTVLGIHAQDPRPESPAPSVGPQRTAQELEQLVAPIALYPDALIALLLPASTAPADVVLAARHVREFPGDRSQVEHRAWDESVKSLTYYPEVLQWMDENLQWTKQLGEAFAEQPADVMQAVQRLRAKARAAGTLVDTPQQQIISEPQVIRIVPAQPDVIYVPHYEPEVVFVDRPVYYTRPFMTFGVGVAVGSWLAFDCDWRRHSIWVGNRHRPWSGHDWRRPVVPFGPPAPGYARSAPVRQWRPPPHAPRPSVSVAWHHRTTVVQPSPFGSTPNRPAGPRSSAYDGRRDSERLPAAQPLPRSFGSGNRPDQTGPRSVPAVTPVVPTLPMARTVPSAATAYSAPVAAPAPAPSVAPAGRPAGGNSSHRDRDPRGSRPPQTVHAAPLPSAPSLPMSAPASTTVANRPAAPAPQRAYTRSAPPPAAVPSLPMAAPARGAAVGPTAPAAVAPAAGAPAAATPAPARGEGGNPDDRRGRRNDQAHER